MKGFVLLPNGDLIHRSLIKAVLKEGPSPFNGQKYRLLIYFSAITHMVISIVNFNDEKSRDDYADKIRKLVIIK